ncbi:MAG: hypothetical protein V5A72_00215 [Candidatus Nanohaloarchaea archaeon]
MDSGFHNYGLQMAFTVLALSMILLVNRSSPISYIFLLGIPVLLGYTTYISKEEFNKASLTSSIALIFVPLGGLTAIMAVIVPLLNVKVSFFASGDSFRDFYSSTALPLLVVGLIVGSMIGGYSFYDPSFENQVQQTIVDKGADRTMAMIEATGLGQNRTAQIKNATYANVLVTENYVVPRYVNNSDNPDVASLRRAFRDAREDVPQMVAEKSQQTDVRDVVERTLEKTVSGRIPVISLVFMVTFLYALQPVIGLLNAFSASLFKLIDERISHS